MKKALFMVLALTLVSFHMLACNGPSSEVGPQIEEGKADLIGNLEESQCCNYDYQCKADHGLVCRPTYDANLRIRDRCEFPAGIHEICLEDDDCDDEMTCEKFTDGPIGNCMYGDERYSDAGPEATNEGLSDAGL